MILLFITILPWETFVNTIPFATNIFASRYRF